ncbi:MAG: SMP-30/gluconolactonase/LRE family protein, partial [Planctomycetes bacterium]|nr:SMP-30/gluconolactonase/LRE family protein [Planctomycetota bacterium]
MSEVKAVIDFQARLGEGPMWHEKEQVLYWVDIDEKKVHRYDPVTGNNRTQELPERVGTIAPRANGEIIVALESS